MNPKKNRQNKPFSEHQLLADFLHELNISRRSLTLYPMSHPQVAATSGKTLQRLDRLFSNRTSVTFGIAPQALFFEHQWLDKDNPAFKTFAIFLSSLGIASISFEQGIDAEQLIRFCQLLRSDRTTIESFGGFKLMLEQQQITKISIVPIDYSAFQASDRKSEQHKTANNDLWEDFLHGLLEDILELGDDGFHLDPRTIAALLNEKMATDDTLPLTAVNSFVSNLLGREPTATQVPEVQLGELVNHLTPGLQSSFLHETLEALKSNPVAAEQFLHRLSPDLLQNTLAPQLQQQLQGAPRLIELVGQLVANSEPSKSHRTGAESSQISKDMVRARIDVLFSEESHNLYLPDSYQAALKTISGNNTVTGFSLPDDDREALKLSFEKQSVEEQCCLVIFQLLEDSDDLEDEESIQQNLIELSHFFLDTGKFVILRDIYQNWSNYLHSGKSRLDIFTEKVLANHRQQTFIQEVLSGITLWGECQQEAIGNYVAAVGAPYTELVIQQLAQAERYDERKYWMQVLEAIGTDANQLLRESLNDPRWYLIRNLLIVLGKRLQAPTLKAVQRLVDHPHPQVRREVIQILLSCNPATAKRLLIKELDSTDPEARLTAITLAGECRDPKITNYLQQILQTEPDSDFELECKRLALLSLAQIGDHGSLSLLRRLLQKKGLLTSRRQKQFQQDIILSIARYPAAEAKKLLTELANGRQRQLTQLATEQLQLLQRAES